MDKVTLHDVYQAAHTIKHLVRKTPLLEDNRLGQLYLKAELLQPIGAFKVRGAANKISNLSPQQREKGVCTFSTGNHGLAVSYIAKKFGMKATVCMSDHVPLVKQEAISCAGGSIVFCGESQDLAGLRCKELESKQGLTIIPPFDDAEIIAGQGTISLEILHDVPDIDTLLVPLSGGGLLSGVALTAKSINPKIRVIGVCMERGAAMYESLRVGHPVEIPEVASLADSLQGGIGLENQYTFDLVKTYMDDVILLTEDEIAEGMRYLIQNHHLVSEGAGAVGVAAIIANKLTLRGKTATIISGGNVGIDWVNRILK